MNIYYSLPPFFYFAEKECEEMADLLYVHQEPSHYGQAFPKGVKNPYGAVFLTLRTKSHKDFLREIEQAKKRHVTQIKNQLKNSNNNNNDIINLIEKGDDKFVRDIEVAIANQYNEAVGDFSIKGELVSFRSDQNIKNIDNAWEKITKYLSEKKKINGEFITEEAFINYAKLKEIAEKEKVSPVEFSSAFTKITEVAALLPSLAEGVTEDALNNVLLGTQGKNVVLKSQTQAKTRQQELKFYSKAADFRGTTSISLRSNAMNVNIVADYFASVKANTSKEEKTTIKFVSASEGQVLYKMFVSLYGGSNKNLYAFYNTMAHSKNDSNSTLATNYRIIRTDLLARYLDIFLTGANPTQTQSILVYDNKAYSFLEILENIYKSFDNVEYKQAFSKNLGLKSDMGDMTLQFKGDFPSPKEKFKDAWERSNAIIRAINKMTISGKMSINALPRLNDGTKI